MVNPKEKIMNAKEILQQAKVLKRKRISPKDLRKRLKEQGRKR
jgi:hypothetical protein